MPLKCALWRRFPVPPAAMLSFPFQLLRSLLQSLCPPQCRIAGRQAPPGSAASGRETAGPDLLRKAGREARRRICTWLSIGTVLFTHPGQAATYIDSNINTVKNHICYTVIAIDSCLNSTPGDTFCLINLQGKGVQMADSLHWSPFVGYGLSNYTILA